MYYFKSKDNKLWVSLKTSPYHQEQDGTKKITITDENYPEGKEIEVPNYIDVLDADFKYLEDYDVITEEEWNQHIVDITPTEPTEEELLIREKRNRISELKNLLSSTDYQAIKYAEGLLTEEEYSSIKAERQSWRDEINELEEELK